MKNKKLEIPKKPFADFKWKWASVQCTEGINDPVVLLGILFRMAKLEGKYKYSSEQFGNELIGLSHDLQGTGVKCRFGKTCRRTKYHQKLWTILESVELDSCGKNGRDNYAYRFWTQGRKS